MSKIDPLRIVPGSHRPEFIGLPEGKPGVNETVEVILLLRRKRPLNAHALIEAGVTLPMQVLEDLFGSDENDVDAVREFARANGFWIDKVEKNKRLITLHGSVRIVERAFKVSLELREQAGKTYRVRSGPVFLPHSIADVVTAVFGLDNRPQAAPHLVRSKTFQRSMFRPKGFDGNQLASIYDFPEGNGSGQTIALIQLGGGVLASDLTVFFNSLNLPVPKVIHVSVHGGRNLPGVDALADAEVTLGVQIVGAVAPNASIVIYHSTNDDAGFLQAVLAAIHDNVNKPSVISISCGAAEAAWTKQAMKALNEAFESAAVVGISVLVAAGDDGVNDNMNDGSAHVDFPSSSPWVTACGGTTLVISGDSRTESAWNDGNGSATGGGISNVFGRPRYQASTSMPANIANGHAGRGVPDVSAVADPATGYVTFLHGSWTIVGGTSAVTPLLSGLILRMNEQLQRPVGAINNLLYTSASAGAFNDIISGDNSCDGVIGYTAQAGWDPVTGWGSPRGQALLKLLSRHVPPATTRANEQLKPASRL